MDKGFFVGLLKEVNRVNFIIHKFGSKHEYSKNRDSVDFYYVGTLSKGGALSVGYTWTPSSHWKDIGRTVNRRKVQWEKFCSNTSMTYVEHAASKNVL